MKDLFPQYTTFLNIDYGSVWNHAIFVFDTNVLLNLYRYQSKTRDELLNVLDQLSARIWIPHHAALEFHRNRLSVIADQNKRFSDVRRAIEKSKASLFSDLEKLQLQKRHSLINSQPLIQGFENLVSNFFSELNRLEEEQQNLTSPDPLLEKIEIRFDGRVGDPPKSQKDLDKVYAEAEKRFKLMIPPGFKDADKGGDIPDEHIHQGIIYKRKFGDYLIWQQILDHAKDNNLESIIFVTDDEKEDWWLKIDADGQKTIGPRPELIEEANQFASVSAFLMYNSEGFLKYAKEFLEAQVSEETLNEVRDISLIPSRPILHKRRSPTVLVSCPNCGQRSLRLGDGEPHCVKCSWSAYPEEAADSYARVGNSFWKHPKHGPDDETGTCEYCGEDAVVELKGEDKIGKVDQKIRALWRALQLEPGAGDAGFSVCFACGEVHYGIPEREEPW